MKILKSNERKLELNPEPGNDSEKSKKLMQSTNNAKVLVNLSLNI